MRPIKFRAWDKKLNRFRYFDLLNADNYVSRLDSVVQQFTGLKDKKGVEIFEGDIVEFRANYTTHERCGWRIGIIIWNKYDAGFEIKVKGFEDNFSIAKETDEFYDKAEVIGNIYENKKLCLPKKTKK